MTSAYPAVSANALNIWLCCLPPLSGILAARRDPGPRTTLETLFRNECGLLAFKNAGCLSMLLELASTVSAPGSLKVVLLLLVQPRQNPIHGHGGHEREPDVSAVVSEILQESTKEESTEHGTELETARNRRNPMR